MELDTWKFDISIINKEKYKNWQRQLLLKINIVEVYWNKTLFTKFPRETWNV